MLRLTTDNKEEKGGNTMSLEDSVKALIVSEYPLDSVIASSNQSKDARKGIVEYVKSEKPDIIFVDGLVSRIRYPEAYIDGIIESHPLKKFMDAPFRLASEFLKELKDASPSTEIYMDFSDADEDNIRRLTKYTAIKIITENSAEVKKCDEEIKKIKDSIKKTGAQITSERKAKAKGWEKSVEAKKKESALLGKKLGGYQTKLKRMKEELLLKMPNAESVEWREIKKITSEEYINKLKELNPGINIQMGNISTEAKGYTFEYAHSFYTADDHPLKKRTNKLVSYVDKRHMGRVPLPHFIIESGHHGETVVHPYKHGEKDIYSLICTGMVMEDQKVVNDILNGKFKPEIFQGKVNKLEACKRQTKKIPAPGVSIVGRNKDGYFVNLYSMDHLAKVGRDEVKLKDMDYETITVLSDIHVGKGKVQYDRLESAIEKLVGEIRDKKKAGLSAPMLFMLNESLQGFNYKTLPVEVVRKIPTEYKKDLEELVKEYATKVVDGKEYVDAEAVKKLIKEAVHEQERVNEPSISNQTKWFHELTKKLIPLTLLYCNYQVSVLFAEGTHIKHTVGEFGIKEVDLQSIVYDGLDMIVPALVEAGELKDDTKLKGVKEKIKKGSYLKFDMKIGDVDYKLSAVHKPGSATPASNIPMQHVERAITMSDDADMFFSAHLHTPYFFAIGKMESNDISAFYKGATFNSYDDYGKEGGWSPAVIGYEQALVPKNKNGKGAYKVQFVLSDVL